MSRFLENNNQQLYLMSKLGEITKLMVALASLITAMTGFYKEYKKMEKKALE